MKLYIKIDKINYADIALMAQGMLGKSFTNRTDAIAMAGYAASRLSEGLIRDLFAEISDKRMSAILAAFAKEYKWKILSAGNELLVKNHLGVKIDDFDVTPELEISVNVAEIDYPSIVERFLPMIKEKLMGMGGAVVLLRPVIQNASAHQICGLLDTLLGSNKESFIIALVNQYSDKLVSAIEDAAGKKNIRLKIDELRAVG